MATSIFFNGRLISVSGSYSEIDASGLESVGLGASGIVAVIGNAEGGKPVSAMTNPSEFIRLTKPEQGNTNFRSGDLREAVPMLFGPGKDADILAGAQEVVAMKTNPATQATATFANGTGDALDLTSLDYGAFASQINVEILTGTSLGKKLIITFEDVTEAVDDLGGTNMFTLKYTSSANAWDTMSAQVLAGGNLSCLGTRAEAGNGAEQLNPSGGIAAVISDNVGDVGQQVAIYGLVAGVLTREVLALNGTTKVDGSITWDAGEVYGFVVTGTLAGNVQVGPLADPTTLPWYTGPASGADLGETMYVSGGKVTVVAGGASVQLFALVGKNPAGAFQMELLTLNGTTPVISLGDWSEVTAIVSGNLLGATTITLSAEAARSQQSVQSTLQKMSDFFNARFITGTGGFVFAMVTAQTSLDPDNLDVMSAAVSCLDPANPGFLADLYAIIAWVNQNSAYVSAARASGAADGAPSNTTSPVFLSGGTEGTTAFADYQAALNLLKQTRINSIVVLSGDPAVHAAVDAHCAYMGGVGRSERDAFVGVLNAGLTDVPSKDEFKTAITALNTRHIRALGQAVDRFNTSGERAEFLPPFAACVAAGMQAGSPVGTSLTFKYTNTLSFRQHSTWNPTDDAEEMIQAGALFMEQVEGVGRRWVRNVTTHLTSDNIAFIEGSVNEAVNFAAFNFRTNMEFAVGKKGFSGTVNAAKGVALNTLGLLTDAQIIVTSRSLNIELIVDVMEVSVELAPVIPINFVKSTIHLVTIRQSAA